MIDRPIAVILAVILDRLLGDPRWLPHPVVGIGRVISTGERALRRTGLDGYGGGIILVIVTLLVCVGITTLLLSLAASLGRGWRIAAEGVIGFFSLAARSLHDQSRVVDDHLERGDLPGARHALSQIVGRDTHDLEQHDIRRAAVETVAENSSDGVIAPLLALILFGGVGAIAYKCINTLDSMVGYRSERYLRFGWCAARLDDLANLIPARLTALLIALAAPFCGGSLRGAVVITLRDGRNHLSPNSGYPEAAVAGALGIRLGGSNRYFGELYEKPTIGDPHNPLDHRAWKGAVTLMYRAETILLLIYLVTLPFWGVTR